MQINFKDLEGFPYKHLGDDVKTGIDCFNLWRYTVHKYTNKLYQFPTSTFCDETNENWYNKISEDLMQKKATSKTDFIPIKELQVFDIVLFSIGATNVTNHCATYLGNDRLLQIMIGKPSWIAPYGRWYKQYTEGTYRWIDLQN